MSGRYENELYINTCIKNKLTKEPSIFVEYYYSLLGSGKSYNTAKEYIDYVLRFAHFINGNIIPEDFYKKTTYSDINRYITSLRTRETKNGIQKTSDSLKTCHWSALNSFYQFLVPQYISENPVSLTQRPKTKDDPHVTYLTEDEMNILFDNVVSFSPERFKNRDLCIFKLGCCTGLRISAITQIDINDIDFENKTVSVIEKGDKKFTVLIGDRLMEQINLWIEDRKKYFPGIKTNALFVSQKMQRLSPRTVNDLLKKYSVGINKNVTPHVMRHTCATNLYQKTKDIYLCAEQLHHKNVSTTQRYATISDENKKYARNVLDNLI